MKKLRSVFYLAFKQKDIDEFLKSIISCCLLLDFIQSLYTILYLSNALRFMTYSMQNYA